MRTRWIVTLLVTCLAASGLAQLTTLSTAFKELTKREMTQPGSDWIVKTSSFPTDTEFEQHSSGLVLFLSRYDSGNVPASLRSRLAPTGHPVRAYPLTGKLAEKELQRTLILVDTGSAVSPKLVSLLFDAHMRQPWGTRPAKELIRAAYQALWKDLVSLSPEATALSTAIDAAKDDPEKQLKDLSPESTKKLEEILEDSKAPGSVAFFAILAALSTKDDEKLKERFYDFLGFYE